MWKYIVIVLLGVITYSFSQNSGECKCVMYYNCNKTTGTIITDGGGLITERLGLSRCSCNCTIKDYVCCLLIGDEVATPSPSPTTPPTSPTTLPTSPATKKCGFANPDGVGFKISSVGGDDVLFGEFPWMVGILMENGAYRCGGSLIHPSVVLTAAHCVLQKRTYIARAGEWDSSGTKENLKHQDRTVASIKIHEDYTPGTQQNDIALLFLNGSFNIQAHINVVCLPPSDVLINNERCYVTGWGKDRFGVEGQYPSILKKIDLPLIEKNICQANLKQTNKLGRYFNLHRSFICAGGEKDKDACIGDGGGPLFCPLAEEDKYQQIGIVSWGIGCNQENVPGVYTNVPFFREWIDKEMKDRNHDISVYQY